jgi:O-antigen/teichoic acid export membrane protein
MKFGLFKSSLIVRNVAAVASGTAAAQIVVVAFSPIITRIYTPEVFGLQGIFLSLISILSPVIALRYPMAIITAETESEALRLSRLALLVAFAMAGVLWMMLLAGGDTGLRLLGAESLGGLILFLPLALLCVALQDVAEFRAARLGVFRLVGIVAVLQAFATNLARVLGGGISPVAAVLVSVTTFAPAVKAAMLMFGTRELRRPASGLTRGEALSLLKKHRDFPLYRVPTDVIGAISQSAPVIMLAALFSPSAAGLYVLARTVVNLPLNVLGSALGNVLYARFAELAREKQPLLPLVLRATAFQLAVPGAMLAAAVLFFPALFAFAFGEAWRTAGTYAQWMTLWIICMLVNVPGVRSLPVIGKQSWHLFFNSFIALSGVAGILLGSRLSDSELGAVAYFSVATAAAYVLQVVTYLVLVQRFDLEGTGK